MKVIWIIAGLVASGNVAWGAVIVGRELVAGRFGDASAVAVRADGVLLVGDRARGVIERFTPDGDRVGRAWRVEGVNDVWTGRGVAWEGRGIYRRPNVVAVGVDSIQGAPPADFGIFGSGYTGLTVGSAGGGRLYAAEFRRGRVEVFDGRSRLLEEVVFDDQTIPAEYSPHKIEKFGDRLYVAYARRGPGGTVRPGKGTGFVDVFDDDGVLRRRLVTNKKLNAPTGMALGPAWMGDFAGDLLVANAGDGTISAYDRATGDFEGQVRNVNGAVMRIEGLSDVFARGGQLYVTSDRGVERLVDIDGDRRAEAAARASSVPEAGVGSIVALLAGVCGLRRRR